MSSTNRQLAAVMFTDIVGYTALMGSDEDRAFEILSKNRKIHQELVEKYNGTIIKEVGDGFLIIFNLTSDAVYCAIEIQKKCKEQGIPLKCGINEGELVFEGADILGNAVNVASRLESGTQTGCISISGSVYHDIKNRSDIQTKFIKEKRFKNVDEPIKVYEVLCEENDNQSDSQITAVTNTFTKKSIIFTIGFLLIAVSGLVVWKLLPQNKTPDLDKSIAVLPFDYLSQEEDKQYLADGVMDAITSNLAKISELKVIAKTSVMKYKGQDVDVRDIGKELDVTYIVEGSFQLVGDQARLIIQLINTIDGSHLWSNEYDREWADIFKVQSEVSQKIADEIAVTITPKTKELIESAPTKDITAYDYYLKGEDYLNRGYDRDDKRYAIEMYNKAIELDSSYTLAWIGLFSASFNHYANDERRKKINFYLDYATKLDSNLLKVRLANVRYLRVFEGKQDKAIHILKELKSQYPKNAEIYFYLGVTYKRVCDCKNAIANYDIAIKLDPSNWEFWNEASLNYQFCRDYIRSEECLLKTLDLNPTLKKSASWRFIQLYYLTGDKTHLGEFRVENNKGATDRLQIEKELIEGNYKDAVKKLISTGRDSESGEDHRNSNNYIIGLLHHLFLDKEKASEYLKIEKSYLENRVSVPVKNIGIYKRLATVYAALGEKANALSAANKSIQLINPNVNLLDKIDAEINIAYCLLLLEEYDEGVSKLEDLLQTTGKISVELLKIHWWWKAFMKNEKYRALVNDPKYQIEALQQNS